MANEIFVDEIRPFGEGGRTDRRTLLRPRKSYESRSGKGFDELSPKRKYRGIFVNFHLLG